MSCERTELSATVFPGYKTKEQEKRTLTTCAWVSSKLEYHASL